MTDPKDLRALAEEFEAQGRWSSALDAYTSALDTGVTDQPAVLARLSVVYARLGRLDAAEQASSSAISLDPSISEAHQVQAFVHLQRNELSAAEGALENAARLDPSSPRTLFFLADVRLNQGRLDEAAELVERLLGLDARHVGALLLLAQVRVSQRRYRAAFRAANRALATRRSVLRTVSIYPGIVVRAVVMFLDRVGFAGRLGLAAAALLVGALAPLPVSRAIGLALIVFVALFVFVSVVSGALKKRGLAMTLKVYLLWIIILLSYWFVVQFGHG